MTQLSNKSAFITGATKGMGLAIAEKLAQHGYNLLLCARNEQELMQLKQRLEAQHAGIEINTYPCDVSQKQQVHALAEWASTQPVDILINNVGIYKPVSILEESLEDHESQMQINFYTPYYLCQKLGRIMREKRRGHIINISSIASRAPVSAAGTYTVTKYALSGLTHVLRDELRAAGVKVTEIIPGSTLTSSWEGTTISDNRFVLPTDIAQAVFTCLTLSEGANVDELMVTPQQGNI